MPEYLPRASSVYDPAQLDKMFALLLVRLSEISASLTQVASENNRAIGLLPDDRLFSFTDTDRKSVVLAFKSRGRLHKIQMQSEGTTNPSGGVAPATPQFVVSVSNLDLPNADVLTGTVNQITVTNGTNLSTLSTPQDIAPASAIQARGRDVIRYAFMGI